MRRPLVTASVMLAMFLAAMEVTIVATAMPAIVSALGGFAELTWVFSLFLLAQTATIPIYGKLADLYGRRPVFAVGTGIFLLGSLLCGAAPSMPLLIAFRALQGIGAGAIQPIATTIIGDIFSVRERARMQGLISSVWVAAAVTGPLIGGFIVERTHWSWVFWINLPLGLLTIAGVWLFLREPGTRAKHQVDYPGAVLLLAGVSLLLFALQQGGHGWEWTAPISLGLFASAALVLAIFVGWEARAAEPILPLSLFRNRVVAVADGLAPTIGGTLIALTSFVPVYAQGVMGASATVAGLSVTIMSMSWPLASMAAARLVLRLGLRRTGLLGAALGVAASALLLVGPNQDLAWLIATLALMGAGFGFVSITMLVAIQSAVPWSSRGVATGSNMFARQLGSALWVAVLGSLLNATLLARLRTLPAAAQDLVGGEGLGVTRLLLDEAARASVAPELLRLLEAALTDAMQVVFLGVLLTSLLALALAALLPKGPLEETGGA